MSLQRNIFWAGLFIYVASFFLTAVGPSELPIRGYFCAVFTLVDPFQSTPSRHGGVYENRPLEYASVIASGWVNPAFLTYFVLAFLGLNQRTVKMLKTLTWALIPFCWIVFHYEHFYPREGHFVWILGMVLVLFATELAAWFSRAFQPGGRTAEKRP